MEYILLGDACVPAECGVGIEKFNDIREGDTLEAYIMEEVAR